MNDYGFGNFIFELRTERGLSQSELGKILGVSNKAVSKWETGEAKPRSGKLALLAETLGVTVEELLCGERRRGVDGGNGREERGEEISFAIEMLAREYRRASTELLVFSICFFSSPVLLLLVIGIAFLSGEVNAVWAIAPVAVCAAVHAAAEAGVIVSFILTVKRRRLLYASFPERREEIFARTHIVPSAKKTGKLGLIVLSGVVLMGIAAMTVLSALQIIEGSVAGIAVGGFALAFGIGNNIFVRLWMKRIAKRMKSHEYEKAVKDAKFLLEVWLPDGRGPLPDLLRLYIASAYFSLSDDGNFREYLGEITTKKFSFAKSFWKLADLFAQGDGEGLRAEYAAFLSLAERAEKKAEKAEASFYGERARLLFGFAEGNAGKEELLPLFENPRLLKLIEEREG